MLKGDCQGGGAEQHIAPIAGSTLHGPLGPRYSAEEAATSGQGESGSLGGSGQGCQPSDTRVPVPIPEPKMELLHQKFPEGKKSFRKNRR